MSSGGEGCYRCPNGGNCTAPDYCTCPPEWTGYDCKTPVCTKFTNNALKAELFTVDAAKVRELHACVSVRGPALEDHTLLCASHDVPHSCILP